VAGIENVFGEAAGDNLAGDSGSNLLVGGAGDDTILGMSGDDTIRGSAGFDNLDGGSPEDMIFGGVQNDILQGGLDDDSFILIDDDDDFDVNTELIGGGNDTLDLSAMASDLTLNIGPILDFNLSLGGNMADASNQIEKILLGQANDSLVFADGASVPGTIDGGLGTNSLDYVAYTTSVSVDLTAGTATGTSAITSFVNVTGGSANDTITGGDKANILDGRSGDDTIRGAGGDDILIGGTTNYDDPLDPTQLAALVSLRLEWISTT
jgi:Ca2+-binding RTX toxin-like protein